MTDQPKIDRFTMPGDIPDAAYWAGGDTLADAQRKRDAARRDVERERGYSASHPAGRGWVPQSRKLGLPDERPSWFPIFEHEGVRHEFPNGTPNDLVAHIGCGQVFTAERRVRFLEHLSFQGNVRAAARLVRVSHETVYRARRQDAKFADLWDAAMVHARTYCESQLATRALEGDEVPIIFRGEVTGWVTKRDPRLMLAHMARLDKRVEEDSDEARAARARAPHFDALLAEYAGHEAPEGFAEAKEEARVGRGRGKGADDLPPSREDYVRWARSQQAGTGSERTEAARMDAAGEAAGALWDEWHAGVLARVEAILRQAQDEREGEGEGEHQPVPPSFVTPANAGAQRTDEPEGQLGPRVRGDDEGGNDTARAELTKNPVTPVNPQEKRRRAAIQLRCGAAFQSPYSAGVIA